MKLNLGCGFQKIPDFIGVDKEPACSPDQIVNLEKFPWPWPDNSVEEIVAFHILEHLGATPDTYLGIIKELWRICKPDAKIYIAVPHPRHENFMHDPTHVRPITPIGIALFDQTRNLAELQRSGQESKLGFYAGVDFQILEVHYDLADPYKSQNEKGSLSAEDLDRLMAEKNNVCMQIRMLVRAIKPCRVTSQPRRAYNELSR